MNERLKELRTIKGLSQRAFGEIINLSPDMISLLEKGKRKFTERVISDICREFNVNRDWFETGCGDKFIDILSNIDEFVDADEEIQEFVRLYMQLDDISKAYYKKRMLEDLKK